MSALDAHAQHFDALYEGNADPWDYAASPAEAFKRRAVGQMLGAARGGVCLELGCGNGTSTVALAPRFARLVAVDGAARAVALARDKVGESRRVQVLHRRLPEGFPHGHYDVIVASEVLYYLPPRARKSTLLAVRAALCPDGCFVVANATATFGDSELSPALLIDQLLLLFGRPCRTRVGAGWRLDRFG